MKWGEGAKKIYEKTQRRGEEVPIKTMGGATKKTLPYFMQEEHTFIS